VFCLDCRLTLEGAAQVSGQSATEDLHQTSVKRLVVPFHACVLKEGFKFWGGRLKGYFFKVKTCKSDPSLLVRRVLFPNNKDEE
jgi:hypothetical protein